MRRGFTTGLVLACTLAGAIAIAGCGAAPATTGGRADQAPTPANTGGSDTGASDLVPAGYGSLRQDDISVKVRLQTVLVRAIPLDESVIRLLSPDSYRALRELRDGGGRREQAQRAASRIGVQDIRRRQPPGPERPGHRDERRHVLGSVAGRRAGSESLVRIVLRASARRAVRIGRHEHRERRAGLQAAGSDSANRGLRIAASAAARGSECDLHLRSRDRYGSSAHGDRAIGTDDELDAGDTGDRERAGAGEVEGEGELSGSSSEGLAASRTRRKRPSTSTPAYTSCVRGGE